ncbi:RagB/SusD family nutrient uptake outer membrane protein [Flavobacterium luteolum]|uniref:RagB/SusD family nutrient uptake outer membrane protein n=1 Tax=Flavobacterium luteolum TaxID=3003259 RepID=UPI00248DEFE3|nr:RagB/SusD family nutrient uptake outer membrane protein [Flavobacterium luteolum]
MIHLKKQKYLALVISLSLYACDSFVEVDLPKSQLTNTAVFENNETATAALMNIYASMRDTGILTGSSSGISNTLGNYTDELTAYGNPTNTSIPFYNNALLPTSSIVSGYWNTTYNQIYSANSIIEGVENSKNLSAETKNELIGEALFLRALLHFYLTGLYGDIPYIKTTDYNQNSTVGKTAINVVFENIIADLNKSALLLPDSYSSTERVRPNKLACRALLSRVYLFNSDFAEAANEASAVLNQTDLYSLQGDLGKVFLIGSKETIWQLQSSAAGQNTKEAATFIFTAGPPSSISLSAGLVSSFSAGDLRKTQWIKSITKGTQTWYHAFKYKEQIVTPASKEYSIVFRLSEQYLNRSEARAQQGDLIGAKEDLNKVRNRAGLAKTVAESKQEILNAVLLERKWEFFTEQGMRFFDLKRFNALDQSLTGIKPGWTATDRLFPIPQNELSTNPNLKPQNPGY